MRRLLPQSAGLAVVLAAALPPAANAGEASLAEGSFCSGACRYQNYQEEHRVVFRADPGERNGVRIENAGSRVTVHDAGAPVRGGAGCKPVDASTVSCALGSERVLESSVSLGDGDDQLTVVGWLGGISEEGIGGQAEIDAGPGDDQVVAGSGSETIRGGQGADELHGEQGDDRFSAGDEDLGAADAIDGGPGQDTVDYARVSGPVRADVADSRPVQGPAGKGDRFVSVEGLVGGPGNDVLLGGPDQDHLDGGPGADLLKGRGDGDFLSGGSGRDRLYGGPGDDVVDSQDGVSDLLWCGGDVDRVGTAIDFDISYNLYPPDPTDVLAPDCERVLVGDSDDPAWPELHVLSVSDDEVVLADPTRRCDCAAKLTLTFGKERTLAGRARLGRARTVRVPLTVAARRTLARDGRIRIRVTLKGKLRGAFTTDVVLRA